MLLLLSSFQLKHECAHSASGTYLLQNNLELVYFSMTTHQEILFSDRCIIFLPNLSFFIYFPICLKQMGSSDLFYVSHTSTLLAVLWETETWFMWTFASLQH